MFRHMFEHNEPALVYFERITAAFLVATAALPLFTIATVTLS